MFIRLYLFLIASSFNFTGYCQSNNYNPTHLYSVSELQTDFQFLRTNLEKIHPNLYLYTPKAELNFLFDSLNKSIVSPMTETAFYNVITLLNSKIKDGHTMLLPSERATEYYNQTGKFFPFYVVITSNKLYVNMNCSTDTLIKDRAELISINGIKTPNIINQLLKRQIRDGNNQTYPNWILTNYFKEYFSFSFGHPDSFCITYKIGNIEKQTIINALSKDSIKYYRQAKYSSRVLPTNEKQGIVLKINNQLSIATLSIKSFDNDLLKSVYKQDFDSTIKELFTQVHNAHVENLILDVRNNQGGDFGPGKLLLSYLLRKSVKYLPNSKEAEIITPKKNSFRGNLFVLINGGSFSSTGILCSYLELTKRSTFIGEETAGNKVAISGDPMDTTLPNTKILFEISTVKYMIRDKANPGHGVVPNYYSAPTVDDIIFGKDAAKEFTFSLIAKNR
jgi:hypothetical protein